MILARKSAAIQNFQLTLVSDSVNKAFKLLYPIKKPPGMTRKALQNKNYFLAFYMVFISAG
jgi:hypothetical protein